MGNFPGGSMDFVNQVFKLFSQDEFKEFKSQTAVVNSFFTENLVLEFVMVMICFTVTAE